MPDTEHRANPLSQVLGRFTRTGDFYARSWGTYLDRQPDELPVARPTIALAAQAFRDEILLAGFSLLRSAPNATTLERIDREVLAAQDFYGDKGWLDNRGVLRPTQVIELCRGKRAYDRLSPDFYQASAHVGREFW